MKLMSWISLFQITFVFFLHTVASADELQGNWCGGGSLMEIRETEVRIGDVAVATEVGAHHITFMITIQSGGRIWYNVVLSSSNVATVRKTIKGGRHDEVAQWLRCNVSS